MFGVRVGLHYGTAVERDGTTSVATVTSRRRVSSLAAGGEVLMTGQTAVLVPELEGVVFESRGKHGLRNVAEPVKISRALRAATRSSTSCQSTESAGWPSILTAQLDGSLTRGRCTTSALCRVLVTSRAIPTALQERRISRNFAMGNSTGGEWRRLQVRKRW